MTFSRIAAAAIVNHQAAARQGRGQFSERSGHQWAGQDQRDDRAMVHRQNAVVTTISRRLQPQRPWCNEPPWRVNATGLGA